MLTDLISRPRPASCKCVMDSLRHNFGCAAVHFPRIGAAGKPFQHFPILCRTWWRQLGDYCFNTAKGLLHGRGFDASRLYHANVHTERM